MKTYENAVWASTLEDMDHETSMDYPSLDIDGSLDSPPVATSFTDPETYDDQADSVAVVEPEETGDMVAADRLQAPMLKSVVYQSGTGPIQSYCNNEVEENRVQHTSIVTADGRREVPPVPQVKPFPAVLPPPQRKKTVHGRSASNAIKTREAMNIIRRRAQSQSGDAKELQAAQVASSMTVEGVVSPSALSKAALRTRPLPPRSASHSEWIDQAGSYEERRVEGTKLPSLQQDDLTNANSSNTSLNPPISFDDKDDSIWVHLVQAGAPIKVKFSAKTRLGDARRMARVLAAALQNEDPNQDEAKVNESQSPVLFLPNGSFGQSLQFGNEKKQQIFVEFSPHTTLSQARRVGRTLTGALVRYNA
jgi:hypothetical protein